MGSEVKGRVFYKVKFNVRTPGWWSVNSDELFAACSALSTYLRRQDGMSETSARHAITTTTTVLAGWDNAFTLTTVTSLIAVAVATGRTTLPAVASRSPSSVILLATRLSSTTMPITSSTATEQTATSGVMRSVPANMNT